jgi:hypothetical protein
VTFRPPLIQPRQPPRFVPGTNQGRVGSTGIDVQFGGPGQWRTYDWPLPRAPVYPNQTRTHIQNVNILLIGKDVQFGAAGQFKTYDWPLPRPYVYPNQTRTWLLNAQIQLIGKDTQFGAAGQFKSYDWPLPRVGLQGKTWTYSLNESTLAPVVANPLPFNQADWPLPRTAPYQNSLRTALDWFTFNDQDTFFGGAGQPPANMDWPLPKTAPASGKTWIYTLNQTTLAPTIQSPFSQTDWPLPRMALYPAQNQTWLDQVKLNLIGLDQFFGAQGQGPTYDWPTPRTAVRLQDYTWLNNLSQSTLAPFIAPMPFGLYDWPPPRSPLPLVDLHSSVQGSGFPDQIPAPPIPAPIVSGVTPGKLPPWPWTWTHDAKQQRPDSPEFVEALRRAVLRENQLRAEKKKLEAEFSAKKLAVAHKVIPEKDKALQNREYAILRRKIRATEEALSQAVTKEIELRLRALEYETASQDTVAARRQRELMIVLLLA